MSPKASGKAGESKEMEETEKQGMQDIKEIIEEMDKQDHGRLSVACDSREQMYSFLAEIRKITGYHSASQVINIMGIEQYNAIIKW